MNTDDNANDTTPDRPLGYWLRIVDALIDRELASAFEGEDVTRRDWMRLNALSGDVALPGLAERLARGGKKLRSLEDRGWVSQAGDGTWSLTDEGRAAKARLGELVDGVRSRVASAVSPEDFATTMASLEAIARELGWEEGMRMPRRKAFGRGRRAFGPGFRPGFGPGHRFDRERGFGPGHGFEHGFGEHRSHCADPHGHGGGHPHHRGHRGRKGGRHGERAYERGFDAGFARGRAANDA